RRSGCRSSRTGARSEAFERTDSVESNPRAGNIIFNQAVSPEAKTGQEEGRPKQETRCPATGRVGLLRSRAVRICGAPREARRNHRTGGTAPHRTLARAVGGDAPPPPLHPCSRSAESLALRRRSRESSERSAMMTAPATFWFWSLHVRRQSAAPLFAAE